MSLDNERRPVKVCRYIGRWIEVVRYIVHRGDTLEYVHPATGHRYLARKGDWRKAKR